MGELPCLGPLPGACLDLSKSRHGLRKIGQRFVILYMHAWTMSGACLEPRPYICIAAMPGACLAPWTQASCCIAWSLPGTTATAIYMPGACLGPWPHASCCIAWSLPGTMCCLEPAWVHSHSCCMPGACLGPCVAWSLPGSTAIAAVCLEPAWDHALPGACLGPQP